MAGLRSHYHVKGSFRVSLCSLYPGLLGAALPRGPLPATRVPPGSEGSQVLGRQQDKLPSPGAQEPRSPCPWHGRGGRLSLTRAALLSAPGAAHSGKKPHAGTPRPGHPLLPTGEPVGPGQGTRGSTGVTSSQGLMRDMLKRLRVRNCTSQPCVRSRPAPPAALCPPYRSQPGALVHSEVTIFILLIG